MVEAKEIIKQQQQTEKIVFVVPKSLHPRVTSNNPPIIPSAIFSSPKISKIELINLLIPEKIPMSVKMSANRKKMLI